MTESDLRHALQERGVPAHLHDGLMRYVMLGGVPGGFMTAVLSNDLMMAFGRADDESTNGMFALLTFLYHDTPSPCHGSPEKVRAWIEKGGLEGRVR